MHTEKFNKYEYQNLICQYELSGLEARILFRLSNVYGQDGKIYASNTKIAIWVGKLTQEYFEKPNKSKKEKDEIKNVKRSIQNALSKLSPGFLDTEINDKNNGRNIFLKNPDTGARYEGVIKPSPPTDQPSTGGVINSSPGGDQLITGGCTDDHPLIIKIDSNNDFNKEMLPQGVFLENSKGQKIPTENFKGYNIPIGIINKFEKEKLDEYFEKYGDELIEICLRTVDTSWSKRGAYVQGAINNLKNNAQMANEQKEIEKNEYYKSDIPLENLRMNIASIGRDLNEAVQ